MEFDKPLSKEEEANLAEFNALVAADLAEVTDDGFVCNLIMPIWADPRIGKGMKISKLVFGHLTIGQLLDAQKKPNSDEQQLKLIADLTGIQESILRQLNPKDFQNAGVVAYIPLLGPRYLPIGRGT